MVGVATVVHGTFSELLIMVIVGKDVELLLGNTLLLGHLGMGRPVFGVQGKQPQAEGKRDNNASH